jgi:phosphatidylserine synthase
LAGEQLDSISDSLTFCLAPSVLVFVTFFAPIEGRPVLHPMALVQPENILVILASVFTLIFGLKRLIDFTRSGFKLSTFHGLATPAMAFLIIVIAHILDPHRLENNSPLIVHFSTTVIIFGSYLMIAKIRYPKIRGKLGAVLAISIIMSLLSIEVQKWFQIGSSESIFLYYRIVSFFGLGLIIFYVFFTPLFINLFQKQK